MVTRLFYLFVFYFAYVQFSFGQNTDQFEFHIVEPTVASLGKYGEYPVNYSTGLPNISIPLFTIKSGSISVPLELRYHGGGIQVNEEATWVGLGWDLFYGGCVTRQINGFPDEYEDLGATPKASDVSDYMSKNPYDFSSSYISNLAEGEKGFTYQPDLFVYNANSVSGEFVLDGQKKAVSIPLSDNVISVSSNYSAIIPQSVTLPDGTCVSYNATDETIVLPQSSGFPSYISAWHIKEITNINDNSKVSYSYQSDGSFCSTSLSYFEGWSRTGHGCDKSSFQTEDQGTIPRTSSTNNLRVTSVKPSEILFEFGRVRFVLGQRDDSYCDISDLYNNRAIKKLDEIIIEKRLPDNTYQEITRYEFRYTYFTGGSDPDPRYSGKIHPNCLKLKLESILKYSGGLTNDPELFAAFTYYEGAKFPKKNSYSKDYWGYYNGVENSSPIPYTVFNNYNTNLVKIGGANRVCDASSMKIGSLESISYPTGGKTKFEWEMNRYNAAVPIVDFYHPKDVSILLSNDDVFHGSGAPTPDVDIDIETSRFDIKVAQYVEINYYLKRFESSLAHNKYDQGEISLNNLTTNTNVSSTHNIYNNTYEELVYLTPGSYELNLYRNCSNLKVFARVTYNSFDPGVDQFNYPIGGLRIKSIENTDNDGTFVNKKMFTYLLPGDQAKSSGLASSNKRKAYVKSDFSAVSDLGYVDPATGSTYMCIYNFTENRCVYSNEVSGLYSNSVNYRYVQVFDCDFNNNTLGYTEYEFDVSVNNNIEDQIPLVSNSWNQGQTLRETYYKNIDNGIERIREVTNKYEIDPRLRGHISGFKMVKKLELNSICGLCKSFTSSSIYFPTNYSYDIRWKHLNKTITTDFFLGSEVSQEIEYAYDSDKYRFSNRVIQKNSNGEKTEEFIRYPLDYITPGFDYGQSMSDDVSALCSLVGKNAVNRPIEKYTISNNKITSSAVSLFEVNGQIIKNKYVANSSIEGPLSIGNILSSDQNDEEALFNPSGLKVIEGSVRFVKDRAYDDGNNISITNGSNGEILSLSRSNGFPVAYVYLGKMTSPVVMVNSANYNSNGDLVDNFGNSFPAARIDEIRTFKGTESQLRVLLNDVRNILKGAMVTTCTYDPLIGMTSQTDPSGHTTYYEYDTFGRLEYVRDQDGNILNKYEYKYATQGTN